MSFKIKCVITKGIFAFILLNFILFIQDRSKQTIKTIHLGTEQPASGKGTAHSAVLNWTKSSHSLSSLIFITSWQYATKSWSQFRSLPSLNPAQAGHHTMCDCESILLQSSHFHKSILQFLLLFIFIFAFTMPLLMRNIVLASLNFVEWT